MFYLSRRKMLLFMGLLLLTPGLLYWGWQKTGMAPGAGQPGPSLVVGVVVELSGPVAPWGQAALKGVQLAVDTINEQGGVNHRPVLTLTADANDVAGLPGFATQLAKEEAVAVLGPVTFSKAESLSKTGLAVPLLSLATHAEIPQLGENVFQGSYDDRQQGLAAGQFAAGLFGSRAVVLVEEKSIYAQALARSFTTSYTAQGGEILQTLSYQRGQQEFSRLIDQAISGDPAVLYVPGYAKEARVLLSQLREKGCTVPVLGGDGLEALAQELTAKPVAGTGWGLYFTTPNLLFLPAGKEFVQAYQQRYGEPPHAMALWAYDATRGLLAALAAERGRSDGLGQTLAGHRGWPVAGGRMRITPERFALRPMAVIAAGTELRVMTVLEPGI
ncbi:MAG: ABC transporter substrate-binding protein [Heliobacteriaceae bacterium]|nr:ABC transporter substrate-binding protein [Heliobacteriaceae bacterium]